MTTPQRITMQAKLVLNELNRDPDKAHLGIDLARKTLLSRSTVSEILARLVTLGWVERLSVDEGSGNRAPHKITPAGIRIAEATIVPREGR